MPTELWLDFLAIRLDSTQAEGLETVMNLVTPDNGEAFVIEVSNATLTAIKGEQAADPNLNITVNRLELETVMGGRRLWTTW